MIGDRLVELNVDCLLRLLRSCGINLRAKDPTSLKDIVVLLQNVAMNSGSVPGDIGSLPSRSKFLIEAVLDLKNNKRKIIGKDDLDTNQLISLKKSISNILKNNSIVVRPEPIGVTLGDIRFINERGKWWLIGSAWKGAGSNDRNSSSASQKSITKQEEALLKLAHKLKLNTDLRRSIFIIIMSASDQTDCIEKLAKLRLKENKAGREILRIILLCAMTEKSYNSFYTSLAVFYARDSYANKITLQYCLWDTLKMFVEERSGSARKILNSAKFFGTLIANQSIPISVLKAVNWSCTETRQILFLQCVFSVIFDKCTNQDLLKIFARLCGLMCT